MLRAVNAAAWRKRDLRAILRLQFGLATPAITAPQSTAPAADSAQLASGLGRKMVLAALFAALVFAALAMYGDVQELRRTAQHVRARARSRSRCALAAGNYALRIVRWHYYLGQIGVRLPVGRELGRVSCPAS